MGQWNLEESEFFVSRFRRYQKKHPAETVAVLNNLDTYMRTLESGVKPALIRAGFIHREPQGVVAIDQRGMKGKGRPTRLYLYTAEIDRTIYVITIGDKNSQKRDLDDCRRFVRSVLKKG